MTGKALLFTLPICLNVYPSYCRSNIYLQLYVDEGSTSIYLNQLPVVQALPQVTQSPTPPPSTPNTNPAWAPYADESSSNNWVTKPSVQYMSAL